MPRLELIFLHSASADGYNARRLLSARPSIVLCAQVGFLRQANCHDCAFRLEAHKRSFCWLFRSNPKMTPKVMISGVKKFATDWIYDL